MGPSLSDTYITSSNYKDYPSTIILFVVEGFVFGVVTLLQPENDKSEAVFQISTFESPTSFSIIYYLEPIIYKSDNDALPGWMVHAKLYL